MAGRPRSAGRVFLWAALVLFAWGVAVAMEWFGGPKSDVLIFAGLALFALGHLFP